MDLKDLTIKKFHQGLVDKNYSAFEITKAFFDYIEKNDKEIGAYINLTKERAIEQANNVDLKLAKGEKIGLLAGAPMAIKDNILIEGESATAASKILANYKASYDATIIKKLKQNFSVFLGKTNMDEFAMGSSGENSSVKLIKNPYDLERVPGGSSGGSAAAVAKNMAVAAFGSDTGGPIRQPANFCGVVGLKPTYGAVSRFRLIAMASSLDQIGPIAKTAEDAAILFNSIAGQDEFDSTTENIKYDSEKILNPKFEDIKKLRIGIPKEYFIEGLDEEVKNATEKAIKNLKSLGFEFREISLPHTKYALACYYIIMPAEVSANLSRFDGIRYSRIENAELKMQNLKDIYLKTRGGGFGDEVKRRIILGTFVLSSGYYDAYYNKAQRVRQLIKKDFSEAFKEIDVILTPVAPTPAFKIGEKIDDPLKMYLGDIFTVPVNLAGLPAISIPVEKYRISETDRTKKLPIGFQLIGQPFKEADILGIGRFYENSLI